MDSDFERWMVLQALPQVGPKRLARLRSLNPPWPEGWLPGLPPMAAAALRLWLEHPRRSQLTAPVEEALEWQAQGAAHGQQRHLLHPGHPRWPALLDQIADPPVVLWALGDLDALTPPRLALVGSRRPTREGLVNARSFAISLAEAGWCLVSGMALGIDGAAQAAALDVGGRSVAVLAGGVDVVYPGQHGSLYRRLRDDGGLLLAESAPGRRPHSGDFPRRNRIVTGVSCGVLVVEAAEHSGSLVSARLAGEQGREVLAVPGSIHSPQARGCLRLIREGAGLIRHPDDLFEELASWGPRQGAVSSTGSEAPSGAAARSLLDLLSARPLPVDVLMGLAGCDVATCQRELTLLEIEGHAGLVAGGWVRLGGGS